MGCGVRTGRKRGRRRGGKRGGERGRKRGRKRGEGRWRRRRRWGREHAREVEGSRRWRWQQPGRVRADGGTLPSRLRLTPRSQILHETCASSSTLSGLRSRWTTGGVWLCRKARPSAIWRDICSLCCHGHADVAPASRAAASEPPSQNSIASSSFALAASHAQQKVRTTFGCGHSESSSCNARENVASCTWLIRVVCIVLTATCSGGCEGSPSGCHVPTCTVPKLPDPIGTGSSRSVSIACRARSTVSDSPLPSLPAAAPVPDASSEPKAARSRSCSLCSIGVGE